jgi:cytochrome c oxidase subunit 4
MSGPVSLSAYLKTGAALLLLLGLTIFASLWHLGPFNVILALLIAGVKALLVAMFFMHLRYQHGVMRLFAAAGLVWFSIMVALTLTDVVHRGWLGLGPILPR